MTQETQLSPLEQKAWDRYCEDTAGDMDVRDFDFDLPQELIAQEPPAERGASRLLVLQKDTGRLTHSRVAELPEPPEAEVPEKVRLERIRAVVVEVGPAEGVKPLGPVDRLPHVEQVRLRNPRHIDAETLDRSVAAICELQACDLIAPR